MAKVYKSGNPNNKKVTVLFAVQVILGVLPVLLLAAFVLWFGGENLYVALIIIIAMFLCSVVYFIAARRYNVLLSGYRGEKALMKLSKKLKGDNVVFYNLPIRYKRNRSELDMLIISEKGILTVEVKNHSGVIHGNDNDDKWQQVKTYKDGKITETEMDNPLRQIRRQREILKSILRSEGYNDLWIDSILYFSSPIVRLKLNLKSDSYVTNSEDDLLKFIRGYRSKTPLSTSDVEKITEIIRKSNA